MNLKNEIRKVARGQLRRSVATAPAEAALRRAENMDALQDAWSMHCDMFPDESMEREFLLSVYQDMAARFAVEAFKVVRAG